MLGLLEPDHVGARGADRREHLGERRVAASPLRAPVARTQVELVTAVEDVQRQRIGPYILD